MWTRFRIGGRWACLLLVKDDCEEYSDGEASRIYQKYNVPSPEGYCWVSGARMKDIEWQAMKDCYIAEMTERFRKLEGYFYTDLNLDSIHAVSYTHLDVYKRQLPASSCAFFIFSSFAGSVDTLFLLLVWLPTFLVLVVAILLIS